MIKKILSLFTVLVLCSGASYMDQEQKYFFASDALIEALQNNVADEQKRADAATKYSELMNQQTGMVSIDNLFAVCRAAGFNTYKKDGFDSCKQFINSLIELDEDALSGFCPGLDANGNNPNGLKSITDKTRIGDFCSSTNIYAGEVVFKKGYNCTCMAYACVTPGYEGRGGACVTKTSDDKGNCLRKEYTGINTFPDNSVLKFCESKSVAGCKVTNGIKNYRGEKGKVVCNATREEIDNAKQLMADHKERQKAAIKYYEVCGKDKNITGKNKYCVEDFFNWTQTQTDQAIGLAQEYARIKNNHTIYCKNQHRESGNDDYIACSTMDGSAVYEFKFDDIKESVDKDRRKTERSALCRLAGGDVGFFDASNDVCKNLNTAQCANLDKLANKYGHEAKWDKNKCRFTDYGLETMSSEDFDKSLAKIDGLDNYAFFKIQVIGIRNNFVLEEEIKKYIKNNLSGYQEVRCDPGYRTVKKADGFLANVVGNHDDIKRCYANNKPIDFVVDDLSELAGYERDSGESGAKCIANDGKFDGHYCRGLTKDECFELERLMLKELKSRGWAGDDDLVDWDERAGACELNASQFANNLNKTGKYTAIAGLTIAGVFTGGTTTAVAVSLMSVELAGMAGEIVTERQKELLPQRWANRFLAESMVCKQASCAEKTLRENMGKISQASDMLNRDVLGQVDDELARLAELLPDDRLAEILQNPKAPGCWETWECQETIFTVMQMASLGAAVGKALVKLPQVLSKRFAAVAAKNATNGATHAGAVTNVVTKATDKADDVVDAVWDATAKRFRDPKTGKFVSGYTKWTDELAEIGVKESVVNGKKVYTDVKTGAALSETQVLNKIPTSMNDDFAKIGVRQIEQADGSIRYLDIRPSGGNKFISETEVLKRIDDMPSAAVKAADNTADVARTGNKAADVAQTATVAANKTDDVADATRAVGKVDDIAKTEKEATDAMAFVDANRLRNGKLNADELNRLRKYYPGLSDAELQAKAQSISKELDTQRLMHGGMTDAEVRAMEEVQRAANGGMTSVEKATKEYKAALKLGSEQVDLSDGWVYIIKSGYTDDMVDAAGLKFHLNVAPDDVERAAPIIQRIVSKYDIPQWKFSQNATDLVNSSQEGKQFTLYMGKKIGQDKAALQQLVKEIDQTLSANGIKTGKVGSNLATGDRLATGSKFVHYRYDQVDAMGRIGGGYNGSYKFVAPETGDIMTGTAKKIDTATDAVRAANNTGDAYVARFGNIKMAQKDEDIILDAIAKKQAGKLSTSEHIKAIRTMDKYFDQAQAVRYAQQMRQDIIESVRLNVDEFTRAGDSGEDIARFFVKHLGPKYGIRSGQLKVVSARLPEGYAQYVDGVIYINSNMKALDFDQLTNLVIHEFGHAIDDLAPQYGVVGRALNAYGDMNALYVGPGKIVDKGTDMYKLIPTERSSHLLGDIVSGTENYGNTKNGSLLSKEIARLLESNNATDAVRGASKADDVTRAANLYEDWKVVRKGRETYDFDFAVLGNNEKELSEFIGYVQKDGYYVQKVGNRIFVKDAFNDLYKKAAAGERSVFAKKDVLSPQRWEELNKRVSGLGLKFVDDESEGFMKLVGETPVKIGDELWESLKSRNWKGVRKNGFYYMFVDGVSGGQHATGLKFHISVSPDDLDKATDVIGGAMKRSGIGGDFKVYLDPDDMTWMKQTGKEFTVYVSQDGYNSSKIQQFISECEQGLRNAGVKTNGFGSNVSGGDRAVSGSRYIRYRYDQLDDLGRPQGFYRSKYDFVAPNAQNGGDIMNGISAI